MHKSTRSKSLNKSTTKHNKQHSNSKQHKRSIATKKQLHSKSLPTTTQQQSTHFSTTSLQSQCTTPTFRPFGGIEELKSSKRQLRLPVSSDVIVTKDEIVKLSQLAYLAPPTSDADIKRITTRITSMVNWLSSITHLDVENLPLTKEYKKNTVKTVEKLYKNDPTTIPFYTPLLIMPELIHPAARGISTTTNPSQALFTSDCNLRARTDIVELCQANDVLQNASYTERSFYVAPKFSAGDE